VSITMEADFCVEPLEEALAKHGKPWIFNTDQGSQFTSEAFTGASSGIALAPGEFSNPSKVFIADLSKATFTAGTPGTWTAPSQVQSWSESSLSAGASAIAVAQGTHIGIVSGEFGGAADHRDQTSRDLRFRDAGDR
jgi:hypothetical protein